MAEPVQLHVQVGGENIIVTLPGTHFRAIYRRRSSEIDRMNFSRSDLSAPISLREFISRADVAANDKARDLGCFA
jgi:hypothetical protein